MNKVNNHTIFKTSWLLSVLLIVFLIGNNKLIVNAFDNDNDHIVSYCEGKRFIYHECLARDSGSELPFVDFYPTLTGNVCIMGTLEYGQILTAIVCDSNNEGDFSYQWMRGDMIIHGQTDSTYQLGREDIGQVITCVVTGDKTSGSILGTTENEITKARYDMDLSAELICVATSRKGASDGMITNINLTIEYASNCEMTSALLSTGSSITGLSAGIYYVRLPETETHFASQVVELTIEEGPECHAILFDGNGGDGEMCDVYAEKGKEFILPECGFSAPEGMEFVGWTVNGIMYKAGENITVNEDLIIKAEWKKKNSIVIIKQPIDWTGLYGKKAIFSVEATGNNLSYQWQYKKSGNWIAYGVTSYDTPDFKVSMNEKNIKWPIRCLITDADGNSVTTDEVWMKLKPQQPEPSQEGPVITTQPSDWRGVIGKKATFSVVATGNELGYQWQYKKGTTWTNYDSASATTANFLITMNEKTMKWAFRCMITDADGKTAMTNEVYMKLREEEPEPALEGPVITTQPSNWIGLIGKKATFSVVANGDGLSYQWQCKKGTTWANYDNVSAITANFQITMNEKTMKWAFRCVITDANGRIATTDEVFMKLKEDEPEPTAEGPVISGQPSDWYGKTGKKATFSVTATGNGLSYQWQYKKGTTWANYDNESATTANFQISVNEKTVKWAFRCVITDADGHVVTTNEVRMYVVE